MYIQVTIISYAWCIYTYVERVEDGESCGHVVDEVWGDNC